MIPQRDTIAAIATPPGRGGVGIVRVSGPGVPQVVEAIVGMPLAPRHATLVTFRSADGEALDQGLAIHFPAPHSYTGEPVLELHAHGGPIVLRLILGRCVEVGARIAQPGEFTQRAFLNGKLDLAQAESVADLIDAATSAAARAATRSLSGAFSREVRALVEALTDLRVFTEATLDFPEEDVEFLRSSDALRQLANIRKRLNETRALARQGAMLRDGLAVVLIGQPNVGKSSLLNKLAGDEVAIVTEIAGTTRDTVASHIDINGIPLTIIDTAGLRDTSDPIETLGIERTWAAVARADLALVLVDAREPGGPLAPADAAIVSRLPAQLPRIVVHNKIDLVPSLAPSGRSDRCGTANGTAPPLRHVRLSAKTGAGMDALRSEVLAAVGASETMEGAFLARARHLEALSAAAQHIAAATSHLEAEHPPLELFAEELRTAQTSLSDITGEFSPDDLLGAIFSRFCIGK